MFLCVAELDYEITRVQTNVSTCASSSLPVGLDSTATHSESALKSRPTRLHFDMPHSWSSKALGSVWVRRTTKARKERKKACSYDRTRRTRSFAFSFMADMKKSAVGGACKRGRIIKWKQTGNARWLQTSVTTAGRFKRCVTKNPCGATSWHIANTPVTSLSAGR